MRALALLVLAAPAAAQETPLPSPGDPARGLALAEDACIACHAVHAGEGAGYGPARLPFEAGVPLPFADVAATAGVTEATLLAWLFTSHPTMPNLTLAPQEALDLAAYILSLAPPPGDA